MITNFNLLIVLEEFSESLFRPFGIFQVIGYAYSRNENKYNRIFTYVHESIHRSIQTRLYIAKFFNIYLD